MKKTVILCIVFLLLQTNCFARDYIVEFVEENYQETRSSFSYSPLIYHSIQVRSNVGPKLLILKGNDFNYRKWLRHYIAEGKAFIAKIPFDQNDLFIKSSAFEIDVTNVHPLNLNLYRQGEEKSKDSKVRQELEKALYDAAKRNRMNRDQRQAIDKKKTEKHQAAKKKQAVSDAQKNATKKKVAAEKTKTKEDEKKRLEQEKLLKARAEKDAADELKLNEEREKKKKEREQLLATLAEEKAREEQRRKQELEQRWNELKKRLLQDERIRGLGQAARKKEIQRRWLELKATF